MWKYPGASSIRELLPCLVLKERGRDWLLELEREAPWKGSLWWKDAVNLQQHSWERAKRINILIELPCQFSCLLMVPPIRHTQPEARRQGTILVLSIEIRPSGGTQS